MGLVKAASSVSVTEVPVGVVDNKAAVSMTQPIRAGFGQPLTKYDLEQSMGIRVSGVVQAVISSEWYSQQASLTDLSNKDSVKALRDMAEDEINHWLEFIQRKAEAK